MMNVTTDPALAVRPLHSDPTTSPTIPLGDRISSAMQGVQHGQITIVVHDGAVVQIDRLIRVRQFRAKR
jgi:hypothetical protein